MYSAAVEGLRADRGEGGRQRDLGQGRAALEGIRSDLGEGGRQRDLGQGCAAIEGPEHDHLSPLRDRDSERPHRALGVRRQFALVRGAVPRLAQLEQVVRQIRLVRRE